jgi:chromosome segregation ATPase
MSMTPGLDAEIKKLITARDNLSTQLAVVEADNTELKRQAAGRERALSDATDRLCKLREELNASHEANVQLRHVIVEQALVLYGG